MLGVRDRPGRRAWFPAPLRQFGKLIPLPHPASLFRGSSWPQELFHYHTVWENWVTRWSSLGMALPFTPGGWTDAGREKRAGVHLGISGLMNCPQPGNFISVFKATRPGSGSKDDGRRPEESRPGVMERQRDSDWWERELGYSRQP